MTLTVWVPSYQSYADFVLAKGCL